MNGVPTTRALLLAHTSGRNADRTVTALTEDFGLLSLTARSARSATAKLGGVLEPFALTTLTFAEGRSRPTAVGSVPEEGFDTLTTDPLGFAAAHVLGECLMAIQRERTGDVLFDDAVETFRNLDAAVRAGNSPATWWVVARFTSRLLSTSGFGLALDRCSQCGTPVARDAVWVSGHGGLSHREHATGSTRMRLAPKAQQAIAELARGATHPPAGSLLPLTLLLREVQLHTGQPLESVRFAQVTGALPLPRALARLLYSTRSPHG
jgi:DNA repair protein RecO